MGVVEFVDVIIVVLLSMLVSIFSLSTFPVLSGGDNSWPPAPARKRTHFFFRLKEKQSVLILSLQRQQQQQQALLPNRKRKES